MKISLLTLSKEVRDKIEELKKSVNIVGLSGGKDSMATCILMNYLEIPYQTVTAEVWWKENITGENPYHYEFLHEKALPRLESYGVKCNVVRSKTTAYEFMTTPIKHSKYPERIGKLRGFPLCGICGIQRDCKITPCTRFYKAQEGEYNVITGIAADEESRLVSNTANRRISLLELLEVREFETYGICTSENLLSPTYNFSDRGGCWFCPNQKIQELAILYYDFPHLWQELMEIQRMPNKVQEKFNRRQTLYDIEEQIKNGVQMKIFMGDILAQTDK